MDSTVRLRQARQAKGLSQRKLADAAGITQVALSHLETGRSSPRLTTARALAAALKVDVDSIWPDTNGGVRRGS